MTSFTTLHKLSANVPKIFLIVFCGCLILNFFKKLSSLRYQKKNDKTFFTFIISSSLKSQFAKNISIPYRSKSYPFDDHRISPILSLNFSTLTNFNFDVCISGNDVTHSSNSNSLISNTSSDDPHTFVNGSNKLTDNGIIDEEWWRTTIQVSIPFMIAGCGTIGAGILLGVVEVSLILVYIYFLY